MNIREDILITGYPSDRLYSSLCQSINSILYSDVAGFRFKNPYYKVYIGYTNNPERRFGEHLEDYNKTLPQNPVLPTRKEKRAKRPDIMYLLYQTSSKTVKGIEYDLIRDFEGHIVNDPKAGGKGAMGKPPYYIYLIIMQYVKLY
ncbi:MAG: GIY-YIG nuclease family protein [Patescibacteria group bacterium]|nr:GIY-YIG nuclease family protein [Patescibacteria group bacterium]